ncbi:MAG: hypothetical protein PHF60_03775 [Candidatus ainarchaeum sp.]|nr:hypothetical protein [Candidatus ainarchaeum sp.]
MAGSKANISASPTATHVPALAIADRFSRYQPETEQPVRAIDAKEDKALTQLKDAWRRFKVYRDTIDHDMVTRLYRRATKSIKDCKYTAADVEKFSLALGEFKDEKAFGDKAGVFLSALVNKGRAKNYTIRTAHLDDVNWLCYANRKNVTIIGNIHECFANEMRSGRVVVCGDAFDVGSLKGGTIVIRGDVDAISGPLSGGNITIWGHVNELGIVIDYEWKNCTITIKGTGKRE